MQLTDDDQFDIEILGRRLLKVHPTFVEALVRNSYVLDDQRPLVKIVVRPAAHNFFVRPMVGVLRPMAFAHIHAGTKKIGQNFFQLPAVSNIQKFSKRPPKLGCPRIPKFSPSFQSSFSSSVLPRPLPAFCNPFQPHVAAIHPSPHRMRLKSPHLPPELLYSYRAWKFDFRDGVLNFGLNFDTHVIRKMKKGTNAGGRNFPHERWVKWKKGDTPLVCSSSHHKLSAIFHFKENPKPISKSRPKISNRSVLTRAKKLRMLEKWARVG